MGIFCSRRLGFALGVCLLMSTMAMRTADAADACRFGKVASMPLAEVNNRWLVDASINGQPVRLQVDTGAQSTVLFNSAASDLGLPVQELPGGRGYGLDGEVDIGRVGLEKFGLGEWSVSNFWVRVMGDAPGWAKQRIAGLLGEDFLSHFDVEFDLAGGKMTLYRTEGCQDSWLAYWSQDAQRVDMIGFSQEQPKITLPMAVNGQTVRAMLDSGAGRSLLGRGVAADVGVKSDSPGVTPSAGPVRGLAGRPIDAWVGSFATVAIGDETIRNTHLVFADFHRRTQVIKTGSHIAEHVFEYDAILGADFMRAHRILVSHSQNRVYFTYAGGPVFFAQ